MKSIICKDIPFTADYFISFMTSFKVLVPKKTPTMKSTNQQQTNVQQQQASSDSGGDDSSKENKEVHSGGEDSHQQPKRKSRICKYYCRENSAVFELQVRRGPSSVC